MTYTTNKTKNSLSSSSYPSSSSSSSSSSPLIPLHGGYRNLLSFQMAQLVYDFTVEFVKKYIDPKSRTKDQTCLPAGRWNRRPEAVFKISLKDLKHLELRKKLN